ncbi:MAG: SCP2 sterol-binding domain-containing protein [Saprospiraceae bacterium]|nr:SCP2 sterol-binding domain-containing protein [Saprospiraceae bacterium]
MTAKEFLFTLPEKVQPETLDGLETTFHFDISGDGGGQVTVHVKDGKCVAEEGLQGEPKCVVKAKEENLMNVLKGKINPLMAILTGKLKISNQGEMMKYAKIFGLM